VDLFKETKAACYVNLISVAFCGTLIGLHLSLRMLHIVVFIAIWSAANLVVFSVIASRKTHKIAALHEDCDIENFLAICGQLYKRRTSKQSKTLASLNLSSAYLMIGDNSAAGRLLHDIGARGFSGHLTVAAYEFVYHNNCFMYYYITGDIPQAARVLGYMEYMLQNGKLPKVSANTFQDFCLRARYALNIENGNYDGAEQFFVEAFEKNKGAMSKVNSKYTLGKIYLHQGRLAEAERAFEYAVEFGGSSIYRARATERLEALGKTVCVPPEKRPRPPFKVFSTAESAAFIASCSLVVAASLLATVSVFAGFW